MSPGTVADAEPALRKPSRLRLVDDVYHSLEEAILAGAMSPGERLVESRICDRLGVSRTTVREALLMLHRQGLVDRRPRRGTFVTRLSRAEADDLRQARALLEGYALTIGYERIDDAAVERLEACIRQMGECRLPAELPQLLQIDLAFHRQLVELARSPRIEQLWSSLNGQVRALFLGTLEERLSGIDAVVALHRALLDAIRSGDRQQALAAVIDHYVRRDEAGEAAVSLLAGDISVIARQVSC